MTGKELTIKGLLGEYASGERNFTGAILRGVDLREADLSGAILSGADLHRANLSGAILSGADLGGVDLREAYLSGAILSGADLREANLSGAYLSGAFLGGANLSGADLSWADLHRAFLGGANLSWADLSGADLSWADLHRAYLGGADLRAANLSGANLSGAYLGGADLREANLSGAKGLLVASDWLAEHFTATAEGCLVYKTFNAVYSPPWELADGATIAEVVNPSRTLDCACGINFATRQWHVNKGSKGIWTCLLRSYDLADCVVPYNTDGIARCGRLTLLGKDISDEEAVVRAAELKG